MSPGSWAVVVLAAAAALLLASRAGVLGPLVAERGGEAAKYSKVEAAPAPVVAREDGRGRAEAEASEAVPQDMAEATPVEPRRVRAERPAREAKARPEDRESAPAEPMEVAPAEAASSLAEEAEALGRAQAAIQGGRADAALEELAGYARRFPQGSLREEYEALRAIALCTAGRTREGRGEAQAFLRDRAASALADRVRGVCLAGQ